MDGIIFVCFCGGAQHSQGQLNSVAEAQTHQRDWRPSRLNVVAGCLEHEQNRRDNAAVDGRNPAPPGMYKTLLMG